MQAAYHLQRIETTAFVIENCAAPSAKTTNPERPARAIEVTRVCTYSVGSSGVIL